MNRTERLQEVLRLEGLAAAANARARVYREELAFEARGELAREGSAPTWRIPDIAKIVLPVSKEQPYIDDAYALLQWCKDRYPEEVETVRQVRGSFRASLIERVLISGDVVIDDKTGEVVPGLAVRPGGVAGSLTITPSHEAKAVYAAIGERMLEDLLTPPLEVESHLS